TPTVAEGAASGYLGRAARRGAERRTSRRESSKVSATRRCSDPFTPREMPTTLRSPKRPRSSTQRSPEEHSPTTVGLKSRLTLLGSGGASQRSVVSTSSGLRAAKQRRGELAAVRRGFARR